MKDVSFVPVSSIAALLAENIDQREKKNGKSSK